MDENLKQYSKFIQDTEFLAIRLVSSKFESTEEYFKYDFEKLNPVLEFKADEIGEVNDIIVTKFSWSIKIKKGNKILVLISASYNAAYKNSEHFSVDISSIFFNNAVRVIGYPYFRQFANSISNDSKIDLPQLPMLKLTPNNSTATSK